MTIFMENYKQQALDLLKSGETGDNGPLSYINSDNYIQHNLTLKDGIQGLSNAGQLIRRSRLKSIQYVPFRTVISYFCAQSSAFQTIL